MLSIFKYPIPMDDYCSLDLPKGAKILTVQEQHGEPQIWALVDPEKQTEIRNFRLAGTGHPIKEKEEDLSHIETFQMMNGTLVFHLFEILFSAQ